MVSHLGLMPWQPFDLSASIALPCTGVKRCISAMFRLPRWPLILDAHHASSPRYEHEYLLKTLSDAGTPQIALSVCTRKAPERCRCMVRRLEGDEMAIGIQNVPQAGVVLYAIGW
jgi:hypothetical protein